MEKLTGLAVFAKVVEEGSFTGAATSLNFSKSTISKHVTRLEERLGARLLNRTTRRLTLTEVGRTFYERCERILAEAEEAEEAVSRLSNEPRGTLRITAPMTFATRHLSDRLPKFMAQHPDVSIEIELGDRVVNIVDEGFDVAIRISRMADSSLIARRFASSTMKVCASPEYWEKHGKPQTPQDLKDHNCLLYSYRSSPREWRFKVAPDNEQAFVSVRVSGTLLGNNGDMGLSVAKAGLGVAYIPAFHIGNDIEEGLLEPALDDYVEAPINMYAVYPHARHLSPKVRVFVDFLVESFKTDGHWD
ncbi:MAG: LysR family transcriptional regulator [Alphaproteobacteria bacterium]|nr:LysR family transcriptional regulator [Rhodospirillales bacterium]MCW9046204.1 LysR family transcriptional regulator [Alphaproteobacteria bacterium]